MHTIKLSFIFFFFFFFDYKHEGVMGKNLKSAQSASHFKICSVQSSSCVSADVVVLNGSSGVVRPSVAVYKDHTIKP